MKKKNINVSIYVVLTKKKKKVFMWGQWCDLLLLFVIQLLV